jgi:phage FluMu protein Com
MIRRITCLFHGHILPPLIYPAFPGHLAARCRRCKRVIRYRDVSIRERKGQPADGR